MAGWKKRGEENLTKDTPPKKSCWTALVRYVFHPPGCHCSCFPVQRAKTEQTRSLFGRVQKFIWRARSLVRFPTPILFAPPHIIAQLLGFLAFFSWRRFPCFFCALSPSFPWILRVRQRVEIRAACYRTEKWEIQKMAGEGAGKSAAEIRGVGGSAGEGAARGLSLERNEEQHSLQHPEFS